ncbi:MAG: hypothetical protein GQ477_04905 [Nanohaloarchaea archaeon]|nr:hypothetical protein [Candidatus Nanohaloarchaea archaeon]
MIDIIAYSLVTFFLFTTSLAILEIKAYIEHQPDTRVQDHEKILADSFSFGDPKVHPTDNINLESIKKKAIEPEHMMIPKTINPTPNNTPDDNRQSINDNNIQAIIDDAQNKQTKETRPKSEFEKTNDKLENLIAQFENEINKTKNTGH